MSSNLLSRIMRTTRLLATASMTSASRATLITFDVDGTLVKGSGQAAEASAHAKAFASAVGSVLGSTGPTPLPAAILPPHKYHGSTDGLIALRLAEAALGIPAEKASAKLPAIFQSMYEFCARLPDEEMTRGIEPLPGVLETLRDLGTRQDAVLCGLVTGNVEGIARKKMRSVGIAATGALSPPAPSQSWAGEEDAAFLGGFGSDFCSNDISNDDRNFLDRGEQLVIATERCRELLAPQQKVVERVVHVGDAPADVLAAKHCADAQRLGEGTVVGCVAVATGSYSAAELRSLCGEPVPGRWEPVVLESGLADPTFLSACGLQLYGSVGRVVETRIAEGAKELSARGEGCLEAVEQVRTEAPLLLYLTRKRSGTSCKRRRNGQSTKTGVGRRRGKKGRRKRRQERRGVRTRREEGFAWQRAPGNCGKQAPGTDRKGAQGAAPRRTGGAGRSCTGVTRGCGDGLRGAIRWRTRRRRRGRT